MRTVEDLLSACGAYRLTRSQEFRTAATVQHAIVARVGDGAVLLELADAGCRVDTCFFDAERPGLLHLCVSRLDGSLHHYNQRDPRNDQFAVCRPAAPGLRGCRDPCQRMGRESRWHPLACEHPMRRG